MNHNHPVILASLHPTHDWRTPTVQLSTTRQQQKKGPHPWSGQLLVDCRRLSELQLLQGFLQSLNLIILRLDLGVKFQILYLQLRILLLQIVQMAVFAQVSALLLIPVPVLI